MEGIGIETKKDILRDYNDFQNITLKEIYKKYNINYGILHNVLLEFDIKLYREIYINFKKFYMNGDKYSIYIQHNGKKYNFEFEHMWNNLMYNLFVHDLNTKRIYEKLFP